MTYAHIRSSMYLYKYKITNKARLQFNIFINIKLSTGDYDMYKTNCILTNDARRNADISDFLSHTFREIHNPPLIVTVQLYVLSFHVN